MMGPGAERGLSVVYVAVLRLIVITALLAADDPAHIPVPFGNTLSSFFVKKLGCVGAPLVAAGAPPEAAARRLVAHFVADLRALVQSLEIGPDDALLLLHTIIALRPAPFRGSSSTCPFFLCLSCIFFFAFIAPHIPFSASFVKC